MTLHRLLWRFSGTLATERWYNSQFVWNTWEPAAKRQRAGKCRQSRSCRKAGRRRAAPRVRLHRAMDRQQGCRHARRRVCDGEAGPREVAAHADGRRAAAKDHRVRDREAWDRRHARARLRR
jgi:hypothetical protein